LNDLVPPHGGSLNPLLIVGPEKSEALAEASHLPAITLNTREASDVIMLATGAFSPLGGFMGEADYRGVLDEMRLASGLLWPLPVTVSVSKSEASGIGLGEEVALVDPHHGEIMATMLVSEKYPYDKRNEARRAFGTDDDQHPGVGNLYQQGDLYLAGPVVALTEGDYPAVFPEFARPMDTRRIFQESGWSTIAAFQTRNPMHRSHEYLAKIALEVCDGLLVHPIVGKLKQGDVPAAVRMECYHVMLQTYFPSDRVILRVYPMEMRYAGPREALLHAIIRQNFGCSHLIVGRDHAGVGGYYGPFDAQKIFDTLRPDDLHIKPLKLDWTFWCSKCDAMASVKTCPHAEEDRLLISGTKLREMLARGDTPPEHYSRPEVIDILLKYYTAQGGPQ
jgi:sulfate adenylyltransferase